MDQRSMDNQWTTNNGLPPTYPKSVTNIEIGGPSILSSPAVPLAPDSYQIWNRPICISSGDHSTTDATSNNNNNNNNSHQSFFLSPNQQPESPLAKHDDRGKGKSPMFPFPQPNKDTTSHTPGDDDHGNQEAQTHVQVHSGGMDPNADEKRRRRAMLNRMASAKSRLKKYEYRLNLEKQLKRLEAKKVVLQQEVTMQEKEKELLLMESRKLDQCIIDRANENKIRDALIHENKNNLARLKQLKASQRQELQQLLNMLHVQENGFRGDMNPSSNQSGLPGQMVYPNSMQGEIENMTNRFNQQLAINPPALEYGGVAEPQAYYGPELLNNDPRLQMQTMPNWDQFGTVQMPNPNLGMDDQI